MRPVSIVVPRSSRGDQVNVMKFGAKGDDSADDKAAIEEAFAAVAARGQNLFFPEGCYRAVGLVKPLGINLTGVPGKSIIKASGAGTILKTTAVWNPPNNILDQAYEIRGLLLDGGNVPGVTGLHDVVGSNGAVYRSIYIRDCPVAGAIFDGSQNVNINELMVNNCGPIRLVNGAGSLAFNKLEINAPSDPTKGGLILDDQDESLDGYLFFINWGFEPQLNAFRSFIVEGGVAKYMLHIKAGSETLFSTGAFAGPAGTMALVKIDGAGKIFRNIFKNIQFWSANDGVIPFINDGYETVIEDALIINGHEAAIRTANYLTVIRPTLTTGQSIVPIGEITTLTLSAPGEDYEVLDELEIEQAGASGCVVRIDSVDENGSILTWTILDGGEDYWVAANLDCSGGAGSGARWNIDVVTNRLGCESQQLVELHSRNGWEIPAPFKRYHFGGNRNLMLSSDESGTFLWAHQDDESDLPLALYAGGFDFNLGPLKIAGAEIVDVTRGAHLASLAMDKNAVTLGNGQNDNVDVAGKSYLYITGPTEDFSISGFTGGVDGQRLLLVNMANKAMTLKNDCGDSDEKILTMVNADATIGIGNSVAVLSFVADIDEWVVLGVGGTGTPVGSAAQGRAILDVYSKGAIDTMLQTVWTALGLKSSSTHTHLVNSHVHDGVTIGTGTSASAAPGTGGPI